MAQTPRKPTEQEQIIADYYMRVAQQHNPTPTGPTQLVASAKRHGDSLYKDGYKIGRIDGIKYGMLCGAGCILAAVLLIQAAFKLFM